VLPLQTVLPALAQDWGVSVPEAALAHLAGLSSGPTERRIFARRTLLSVSAARSAWDNLLSLSRWQRVCCALAYAVPLPAYLRRRYGETGPLPFTYLQYWLHGLRARAR
jgi:hypothetical protein